MHVSLQLAIKSNWPLWSLLRLFLTWKPVACAGLTRSLLDKENWLIGCYVQRCSKSPMLYYIMSEDRIQQYKRFSQNGSTGGIQRRAIRRRLGWRRGLAQAAGFTRCIGYSHIFTRFPFFWLVHYLALQFTSWKRFPLSWCCLQCLLLLAWGRSTNACCHRLSIPSCAWNRHASNRINCRLKTSMSPCVAAGGWPHAM